MKALQITSAVSAVVASLAIFSGPAHADDFIIKYSGQGTSGTAYVTGDALGDGEYRLTSGTLTSNTLGAGTLTLVAPGSGNFANTNGDVLTYDNLLFVPASSLSSPDGANLTFSGGLVFQTSTPSDKDVYFSAFNQGQNDPTIFYFAGYPRSYGALDSFTVTAATAVSAAPEPTVWLLMLGGVGLMGATLRAARRKDEGGISAV